MDATLKITPPTLKAGGSALLEWTSTGADILTLVKTADGVATAQSLVSLSGSMTLTVSASGIYLYELHASAAPITRSATLTVLASFPPPDDMNPHPPGSPEWIEHNAFLALFPYDQATAVPSGAFPDLPAGSKVWIPEGQTVTVNHVMTAPLAWVRVDGTLRFAPGLNTQLTVDRIGVMHAGSLEIGTVTPISPAVTARILIADTGLIDSTLDPLLLGRGIIAHGATRIFGAAKSPWSWLSQPALAGTTQITVDNAFGWRVGDQLAISTVGLTDDGHSETRTVTAISGNVATLDASLNWAHGFQNVLENDVAVQTIRPFAQNLTRNVVIESQGHALDRRGHTMFMHSRNVDVEYAEFKDLGRTDKSRPVTDAVAGNPASLVNPRGRYPVHFHKGAGGPTDAPGILIGCSVVGSPGWGIVLHSTAGRIYGNVVYGITGAGIVAEKGDEWGEFAGNAVINVRGVSGKQIDNDRNIEDWAGEGVGIWTQCGGNVAVKDNAVANCNLGIVHMGLKTAFIPQSWMWFPYHDLYPWQDYIMAAADVPLRDSGNVVCSCTEHPFIPWSIQNPDWHGQLGTISNNIFWGDVLIGYSFNDVWTNDVVGSVHHTGVIQNHTFNNLHCEGTFQAPSEGTDYINGGYFNGSEAVGAIYIQNSPYKTRRLHIDGNQRYGPNVVTKIALVMDYVWWNLSQAVSGVMDTTTAQYLFSNHTAVFGNDEVWLGSERLYWNIIDRSFSLSNVLSLPAQYRQTVGADQDQFNVFVGGWSLPTDAHRQPGIDAWLSASPLISH